MMSLWPENIAHLKISSWIGVSFGATHWYGKLYYKNKNQEILKTLTKKEADKYNINECRQCSLTDYVNLFLSKYISKYKYGEQTHRFVHKNDIIELTIEIIEKDYPQVDLLLNGTGSCLSINDIYWGKDEKIVKKIKELYNEAKKLDFYSGKNNERMEELDNEFQKIIGLDLEL